MNEEEIQKIERAMDVMMCPTIEEGRALIAYVRELESENRHLSSVLTGWTKLRAYLHALGITPKEGEDEGTAAIRAMQTQIGELEAAQQGYRPQDRLPERGQRVIVQVKGWTVLKIAQWCPRWWLIDSNLSDGSSGQVPHEDVERWWAMPEAVRLEDV